MGVGRKEVSETKTKLKDELKPAVLNPAAMRLGPGAARLHISELQPKTTPFPSPCPSLSHCRETQLSCRKLFNYLSDQLGEQIWPWLLMGFLAFSTLPSSQSRLCPAILELNPHPLIGSQGQLAASMLTLLTVHFSNSHPNVNKNKMFCDGNCYQQLRDRQDAEFTDLQ